MNVSLITSVPLVPPWDQGDKNLAYALTTALPEHRFEVLTARGQPEPPGDNLRRRAIYRRRDPSLWDKLRIYGWFLSRPLTRSLRANAGPSPDLHHFIYQPYPLSSWFSRQMPDFRRRPTLHTLPASANLPDSDPGLFFADRVVAISRHGQRKLEKLGLRDVAHIPPGIDASPWHSIAGQAERFKAALGLNGRDVVLFPGHYGVGQGSEVMLEALPLLAAQHPQVCVILACRVRSEAGRRREREVRRWLQDVGLEHSVRIYNMVPDMRPLVGASDIVLLPLETMRDKLDIPTTLLEFLAAGKPIIISDLPPMHELVEDNDEGSGSEPGVGLLVPPGDAEALAQATSSLLEDAGRRRRMGRRGQILVQKQFDIRRVARQYDALYQEIAV